jgi:hypothetical protein
MKVWLANCHHCGKRVECTRKSPAHRSYFALNRGRVFCSLQCKAIVRFKERSETCLKYLDSGGRGASSRRMKERNPMRLQSARRKLSATLRRIGHRPKVRGGNGQPVPVPQQMLAQALGWPTEVVVSTGLGRRSGYPKHYKIDIANAQSKIAVEVNGSSHHGLRLGQDKRKTGFLRSRGWRVFVFTNQQVLADCQSCARTVTSTT